MLFCFYDWQLKVFAVFQSVLCSLVQSWLLTILFFFCCPHSLSMSIKPTSSFPNNMCNCLSSSLHHPLQSLVYDIWSVLESHLRLHYLFPEMEFGHSFNFGPPGVSALFCPEFGPLPLSFQFVKKLYNSWSCIILKPCPILLPLEWNSTFACQCN